MRLAVFLPIVYSLFTPFLFAVDPTSPVAIPDRVTATAIIREMNLARQNPAHYATFLEQSRQNYCGRVYLLPGNIRLLTREGVRVLDNAIRFLNRAKPQPPLALSPGLCLAAADHCREQAGGAIGHCGDHGSDPGNRINRYGVVSQGRSLPARCTIGRRTLRMVVVLRVKLCWR